MDEFSYEPSDYPAELPRHIPVMTLPDVVLFPQAMLPLYIFEPRYREMLKDVLQTNRMFAIASTMEKKDESESDPETDYFEAPFPVATVGVIRACHESEDGTSNLIMEGLARVRFEEILTEVPYRKALISALVSTRENPEANLGGVRANCLEMINQKLTLDLQIQKEAFQFLEQIHDPAAFIDLATFSLVEETARKQQLLETLIIEKRYELFLDWIKQDITDLELYRTLKGNLKDEDIPNN